MENIVFLVNQEPYCIWDVDLSERSAHFLDGIDIDYHDYMLQCHLASDDKKKASIALRNTYYHSIETFFAFLGAFLQAPKCPYAWITKYKNQDLRDLAKAINECSSDFKTIIVLQNLSWDNVASAVFANYSSKNKDPDTVKEKFAQFWKRLSNEFLNQDYIDEYNCIKHGFRISPGGFGLAAGREKEYGVAAPPENMEPIGYSDYGSTFFKLQKIGSQKGSRNLKCSRRSLNWEFEKTAMLLQLVSMSIGNLVSTLKILNSAPPSSVQFYNPEDLSFFDKAWNHSSGVPNMSTSFVLDESSIPPVKKTDLLKIIKSEGM